MHEEWTNQLSDYLDGELPADGRDAVEAHLRSCAPCAAVLHDLKRVVVRASALEPRPPHTDLWIGIAGRLDQAAAVARVVPFTAREPKRFAFTLPQLAAAAAVLAAVSGGAAWQAAGRLRATNLPAHSAQSAASDTAPTAPATGAAEFARAETVSLADAQYEAAVGDLEKALRAGRSSLDASTIAIVEHNLQIIDQAISQAREALGSDPGNTYLSGHLVEARRRKLDLLRRAAALAADTD